MSDSWTPGCEEPCEECRSRYAVPDYDASDGTYSVSYECSTPESCDEEGS